MAGWRGEAACLPEVWVKLLLVVTRSALDVITWKPGTGHLASLARHKVRVPPGLQVHDVSVSTRCTCSTAACSNMGRWQGRLETQGSWWLICSVWWHNNSIERGESNKLDRREVIVLRNYIEHSSLPRSHASVRFVWFEGDYGNYCVTSTGTQTHSLAMLLWKTYIFCQDLLLDIRYYLHSFCIQSATTYDSKKQVEAFTLISSISISQHIPESFIFVILFLKLRLPILSSITLINQRLDTNYFSG